MQTGEGDPRAWWLLNAPSAACDQDGATGTAVSGGAKGVRIAVCADLGACRGEEGWVRARHTGNTPPSIETRTITVRPARGLAKAKAEWLQTIVLLSTIVGEPTIAVAPSLIMQRSELSTSPPLPTGGTSPRPWTWIASGSWQYVLSAHVDVTCVRGGQITSSS